MHRNTLNTNVNNVYYTLLGTISIECMHYNVLYKYTVYTEYS